VKIKGQLQWTDYRQAQLLHSRPTGWVTIVMNVFLAFWVGTFLLGLFFSATGRLAFALMVPGIALVALFVFYRFVLMPRQIQQSFSQQEELAAPFELEITEAGLNLTNEFGQTNRPWENFTQWKENKELFLLYHADVLYTILPKRLLSNPEEIDTIRTNLRKNNIPVAENRSQVGGAVVIILFFLALLSILIFNLQVPGPG